MTTDKNESLIGFDPLAWMNEDDDDSEVEVETTEVATSEAVEGLTTLEQEDHEEAIAMPINEVKTKTEATEIVPLGATVIEEELELTKPEISLGSTLNIQNVSVLYELLLKALEDHSTIELDASAVKMVDTATLQLFVVLKQESIKLQKEVNFEFPSDNFIDSAKILGVYEMLGLDTAAAGFF